MKSLTGLVSLKTLKGKYIDAVVLSARSGKKKFIQGVIKCPFTNKEFHLIVASHNDQFRPGYLWLDNGFVEHVLKTGKYSNWIFERVESYSRDSFHRRKVYVCCKCYYKDVRFIDVILHLITIHNFLIAQP